MRDDRHPIPVTPPEEGPLWESDADEREARRRRLLFFGGSAAAVLVGFVGLYAALSWIAGSLTTDTTPPPRGTAIGDVTGAADEVPSTPIPAEPGPAITADDLEWYAIDAPLGFVARLSTTDSGTFYALSTIPGRAINWPVPKAMYKSLDGENWDIIPLDDSNSASDMAVTGTALYVIGTAPAVGDRGSAVTVSVSRDEGETWASSPLPSTAGPPAGAPVAWSEVTPRIAAADGTVVATVQSQFTLDYQSLVPAEFRGEYDYRTMADGVQVIDYRQLELAYAACEPEMATDEASDECRALFNGDESAGAVGFVTWEEMGLAGGEDAVLGEMFVSTDGEEFEPAPSPFNSATGVHQLFGTDGGFVAVESGFGRSSAWYSSDGRAWEQIEVPELDWINRVGSYGGQLVLFGDGRLGPSLVWQNESGDWAAVDFDAVLGAAPAQGGRWLAGGGAGALGVVAVFQSFDERTGRESAVALLGTSPQDWSMVPIDEITGATGGYPDWIAVGRDQILINYQVFGRLRPLTLQIMGVHTG